MKTNHLVVCFLLAVFSFTNAQSVSITLDNPEPMEICNLTTTQLKARVNFEGTIPEATISVVLPEGIAYVPGSITRTETNKPDELKIQESDIKNLSKPVFKVVGKITSADWIAFSLRKNASCLAYNTKKQFIDQVTVQIGNQAKTEQTKSYSVNYPSFSIQAPNTKTDAVPNKVYTRSFTVTNGGTAFANAIYLDIAYDKDIQQEEKGLRLASTNGTKIVAQSINGNVHRYVIDGDLLGSDKKFTKG